METCKTQPPLGALPLTVRALSWLRSALVFSALFAVGFFLYRTGRATLFSAWFPSTTALSSEQHKVWPGIRRPPALPAEDALLDEDEEVIGVTVAGHARAYVVHALEHYPFRHVVNDLLGDYPVSVTFCERTQSARVFTGVPNGIPLQMDVAGWKANGMALRIGGVDYAQKSGANLNTPDSPGIPYAKLPHVRTSWRNWRMDHPATDVYVGDDHRLPTS